jgi:predicted nucleic acid-binding protein
MNGKRDLKSWVGKIQLATIDTNVFIYYFDRNLEFYQIADRLVNQFISQNKKILSSTLTLTEILSFNAPQFILDKLEEEISILSNLNLLPVDEKIAKEAARIRRENDFRIVDSVQLATALAAKVDAFITNDARLKAFKEIKVILLSEFY